MKIGDFVSFTVSKIPHQGEIIRIKDKASIKYYHYDRDKPATASKALKDLTPGNVLEEYQKRYDRNLALLATQQVERDSNVFLSTDPGFISHLPPIASVIEIGLDIETYGYDLCKGALHPLFGEIRLIQFYLPDQDITLIWDLGGLLERREKLTQKNQFFYDMVQLPGGSFLCKVLSNPSVKKFIHNAAFEGLWLQTCLGINLFNVVDSMILSQIFWSGMGRGMQTVGIESPNSLKWLAWRLGLGMIDKQDQRWDYGAPVGNRQLNYGAKDSKLAYQCGKELLRRSYALEMPKPVDAEMRAIPAFADMRYKGFPISLEKLDSYLVTYQQVMDKLQKEWDEEFPDVNPASSDQTAPAIKERFDIEITVFSKTTEEETYSIAYDVLAPYFEEYPILRTLASINSISKGLKYLQTIRDSWRYNADGIPCVYGDFRQLASPASMGRSGCGGKYPYIQLQTPPKGTAEWRRLGLPRLRSVFTAPPGYKMISFDLSGSHAQIARYCSQDPKLIEANTRGIKIHYYTMQGILEVQGYSFTLEELIAIKEDKDHKHHALIDQTYDFAKTAFYSGLNGGGATRLQGSFKELDPPVFLDLETCQLLVDGTRKAYATLYAFMWSLPDTADEKDHVVPVWVDDDGNFVQWGRTPGDTGLEKMIRPPGMDENTQPRYLGLKKGKYCGWMPGQIRRYGELRSVDGGRYFLHKEPSKFKGNKWQPLLGDATAFSWQRPEGTGIKLACGILTEEFYVNPEWGAWIGSFLHDELMVICKEDRAPLVAQLVHDTVVAAMRTVIPDFTTEVTDTSKMIKDFWAK